MSASRGGKIWWSVKPWKGKWVLCSESQEKGRREIAVIEEQEEAEKICRELRMKEI